MLLLSFCCFVNVVVVLFCPAVAVCEPDLDFINVVFGWVCVHGDPLGL